MKKFLVALLLALNTLAWAGDSFRNPVINADVPDISVCKVADTYYMVSTTMHLMPGAPIMKSSDMVNWETIGYVFDCIDDGDRYDLLGGHTVYGQGQWASSIRYHMGKFYVWFTANGAPAKGFVYEAENPAGPWKLVARPPHHHDASLFFDEDGRRYLFTSGGGCTVVEIGPDFSPIEGGLHKKVVDPSGDPEDRRSLLEGSSVIKHNGKYYICMISMVWGQPGRVRREVCYRADNIEGPYEKKVILETPFETYGGVGQGCLVGDDQSDQGWWALIFQDRGGIGRVPCAMPVTWVDGWPMCGEYTGEVNTEINESPGDNPTGNPLLDKRVYRVPSDLSKKHPAVDGIIGSDEFDILPVDPEGGYHARNGLKLYWQWNHNPVDEAWSLMERPGYMRLKTARVVDNLQLAPNTLTQRMYGPECSGEVKIDVSGMKDGDICGLAAYNGDSGVLRIERRGGKYFLQLASEKAVFKQPRDIDHVDVEVIEEVPLKFKDKKEKTVCLRVTGDFNPGRDMASFAYSLDGEKWAAIGHELPMRFDYTRHFMGTKFAIFNYATKQLGGHADIDWFRISDFDATVGDIRPIPDHIYIPAEKQGKIETFNYTATRGAEKISKKARVYVPFGYNPKDKKKKYNVLYLIHGGGDNTLSFLAPPSDWLPLKNVLDHLIAEGKMDPILVVTPTFYEDDENIKHGGMMDAVKMTEDFHSEFHNDLIPAVEKAYSTFLSGTDSEAITASRQHRAFGGFSMGALTTWYQLAYGNDDVKYYLPLSGDCWVYDAAGNKKSTEYAADWLNEMVSKSSYKDDFQILGYSGTKDIAGNPQRELVKALDAHAPLFRYEPGGALDSIDWNRNLRFAMKTDGEHYYGDINRYLYYALPLLFQK